MSVHKQSSSELDLEEQIHDPLDQPAVLDLAIQHGNAQHVYKIVKESELHSKELLIISFLEVEFCTCCLLPQFTPDIVEPYSLFVDIRELSKVGSGILLYFLFIKYVIFMLFVSICMASLPHIIVAKQSAREIIEYCEFLPSNSTIIITQQSEVILNCTKFNKTMDSFLSLYSLESYCKKTNLY